MNENRERIPPPIVTFGARGVKPKCPLTRSGAVGALAAPRQRDAVFAASVASLAWSAVSSVT